VGDRKVVTFGSVTAPGRPADSSIKSRWRRATSHAPWRDHLDLDPQDAASVTQQLRLGRDAERSAEGQSRGHGLGRQHVQASADVEAGHEGNETSHTHQPDLGGERSRSR
jgi:hypothetical protein